MTARPVTDEGQRRVPLPGIRAKRCLSEAIAAAARSLGMRPTTWRVRAYEEQLARQAKATIKKTTGDKP
jgi:hypothetical protein